MDDRMLGSVCRGGRALGEEGVWWARPPARGAALPVPRPPASAPWRMPAAPQLAAAERVARLLDTGLSRDEVAAVVALIESGASPEVGEWWMVASGVVEGMCAAAVATQRTPIAAVPPHTHPQAVAAAVRALKREATAITGGR